jgi:hypothetical protein
MRGKLLLLVALAAGYVLGSRAGRQRYEQIKRSAIKFWNAPAVQKQVKHAEDYAKDKAPEVVGFLSDGARKVVSQVSGKPKTTSKAKKPVASSAAAAKK